MYLRYKTQNAKKLAELNLEEITMPLEDDNEKNITAFAFFNNEQSLSENHMEMFLIKLYEVKTSKARYAPIFRHNEADINRDFSAISFGKNGHIFLDKVARDVLWQAVEDAVEAKEAVFDIDEWYDKYCKENEVQE